MDMAWIWDTICEQWWWIHSLLVGLCLGGSLGIWAYREVWYGVSTFFSSPVETRSPFWALIQWLASFVMLFRSGITVALILTWPRVLRNLPDDDSSRWISIGVGIAVFVLLRLLMVFFHAKKPAPPTFFRHPFRWAYYRSVQTPDSLVTGWVDVFLGALLHAGLGLIWYEYHEFLKVEEPAQWWYPAAMGASVVLILVMTSITVLIHPTPSTRKTEPKPNTTTET